MSSFTAKMIKEARINANLSQEEAAKALGITDRTLRSFENNQHPVSVDDLLKMAKLYKTDVVSLLLIFTTSLARGQIISVQIVSLRMKNG